ncbi:MAG: hypothetical protein H8D22_10480, partial [Candidatus Cloacimonetes bacterium]|nr:hypothetical protein [Candidatus Cloacimonadota bacterium]
MAIELVERITDNSASKNSLDNAFAHLTLFANEMNKKSKDCIADIDVLNSKIQNTEVKEITKALSFLSAEYNVDEILEHVEGFSNFNHKLFLLRNWIIHNKEDENIGKAIIYILEEIVKTSGENVPNATTLSDIATPLPNIKSREEIKKLILLFDAHKDSINKPTKDFIKLQLLLAEALHSLNLEQARDRIFEVFLLIDELSDLSINTDCLSMLWLWFLKYDKDHSIEKSIGMNFNIKTQIENNIEILLNKTALHFKMVESIISTIIIIDPDFIFNVIKKLNTLERRDLAFKFAIENYIQRIPIDEFDCFLIMKFIKEIRNSNLNQDIALEIIDRFYYKKLNSEKYISKLLNFNEYFLNINKIKQNCYIITHLIKI